MYGTTNDGKPATDIRIHFVNRQLRAPYYLMSCRIKQRYSHRQVTNQRAFEYNRDTLHALIRLRRYAGFDGLPHKRPNIARYNKESRLTISRLPSIICIPPIVFGRQQAYAIVLLFGLSMRVPLVFTPTPRVGVNVVAVYDEPAEQVFRYEVHYHG